VNREVIERLETGGSEIQFQRLGDHYEIILNGVFIMASYNGRSERSMVTEAVRVLGFEPERVLVGGLGMGFTLAQVLSYPGIRAIRVYETEEAIIRWNKGALRDLNGKCLDDPRVEVVHGDFLGGIQTGPSWDLILVDLDNGPEMTVRETNGWLYSAPGLEQMKVRLKIPGAVSIWCPGPNRMLEDLFGQVFTEHFCFTEEDCVYVGVKRP
jgi:spermidine synthase